MTAILDPRRLLAVPWVYESFQRAVGKDRLRSRFVDEYMRPRPNDLVVDIGCGPGDLLRLLEGVEYIGFDISESYVRAGRERFGDRGTFVHGDLTDLGSAVPRPADLVVTVGVLHHVDDTEARRIIDFAAATLRPGGRFVALEPIYPGPEQHWISRRLILADRGQHVRPVDEYASLCATGFEDVAAHHDERMLRVPYSIVVLECTKGPEHE